ncbi:hypothetical protein D8T62_22385 [Vibrio vulnificus]|nr:hypothetical protein D8T62_22385 [Vibrio vulnificus]
MRHSPLNAALCFNHEKSVGCIFSLLSRLLILVLSANWLSVVAVFWTPIRGREKFRELPH